MKSLILSLLLIIQFTFSFAQGKILVPEEIMTDRKLYPQALSNIQWQGNSGFFTWQTSSAVLRGSVTNATNDTLLKLDDLNRMLTVINEKEIKRIPFLAWKDENTMAFSIGNKYFQLTGNTLTLKHNLPDEAENADEAPVTGFLAYTVDNNLFISDGTGHITVTNDNEKGIVNGQTVHRNEFGIHKGTFWSPSGNLLAFYRMDESMVTEYPLVDITARVAELEEIRYPMAGMTSHQVTLGVYNVLSGSTVFLKTGEPKEQYLTNVSWSPDDQFIFIAIVNRDQNHMKLNKYNASDGSFVQTLFEEKNERYVEPLNPLFFLPGKTDQFIWQSQKDGFNHMYLYNTDGNLIKQVTSGKWVVGQVLGSDEKGNGLFFTSNENSPIDEQLWYVDIKNAKRLQLTPEKGTHNINMRSDGKYFISTWSNINTPPVTYLKEVKGKTYKELNKALNPLIGYALGEMTISSIKADDGNTDLYYRLIKPANFDPSKKYPVFLYVYGGPHDQLVTDIWMSGGLFLQYMAQQGYVVFTLDNRGSSNRGFAFESIIHRQVGKTEMEDQMKGVDYLKSLPFVDTTRIGVDGWSYGGFMSVNLKLNHPEVFKVATAGGPVCDWKYYEVMYGERYMDTPEQNPEGYIASSLIEQAGKLKGKLLILHGGVDNTVVWQNSLAFLKACIDNKKQLDYFVYPTHEHNVSGIDRAHLYRKIAEYFNENL
ncbi:MAG TPA: DPP IV N-terminal domain-containing protein [Lentimicrobium sp.]|nr:DPP IV N-terminal domain-containing protein [Lentimicrobium sp.]